MPKTTTYLLTGDIGGTNSRMSLYGTSADDDNDSPLVVKYYRNAEHLPVETRSDPEAFPKHIVIPFLKHCWETTPSLRDNNNNKDYQIIACLATAGLVVTNGVRMTNLDNLLVDGSAMEANTTDDYLKHVVVCRIINDFVAQGYGCLTLQPTQVRQLHGPPLPVDKLPVGPKVCVGAGTGLGECYLTPNLHQSSSSSSSSDDDNNATYYSCFPSEGGHVEYAPRDDLQVNLWKYLSDKFSSSSSSKNANTETQQTTTTTTTTRISVERVVSGTGLANVYEFLAYQFPQRVDRRVHQEFLQANADDKGRIVAVHAHDDDDDDDSLCQEALNIMMSAYGSEVGSAAIKWIPTGGLFVTGGLTPKNIDQMEGQDTHFMKAYRQKGRVSPVLDKIPLFAVMVEDLGVRGAHKAAVMECKRFMVHQHGADESSSSFLTRREKNQSLLLLLFPWSSLAVALVSGFSAGALVFHKSRR